MNEDSDEEDSSRSSQESLFSPIIRDESKTSRPRPMPASKRKQLEEAKASSSNDDASSNEGSNLGLGGSTPPVKSSRPMPASIRQKLEAAIAGSSSRSHQLEAKNDSSAPKKPMPASARRKLEEERNSSVNEAPSPEVSFSSAPKASSSSKPRPMPASVRRKMEEGGALQQTSPSAVETAESKAEDDSGTPVTSKKPVRAMPASAKRNLEARSNDDDKTERAIKTDTDSAKKTGKPMPASARKKLEAMTTSKDDAEVESDKSSTAAGAASGTVNKINISLGGIHFPKISKPMPASARKKMEEQLEIDSKKDESDAPEPSTSSSSPLRSKRATTSGPEQVDSATREQSRSSRELQSLGDAKYPCQFCGMEFYQLSRKNSHEKTHLQPKSESDDKPKESKDTSKMGRKSKSKKPTQDHHGSCPHCSVRISNRKKLARHVYKCGLPSKFACNYCDKKFKYERDLILHTASHAIANLSSAKLDNGNNVHASGDASSTSKANATSSSSSVRPKAMPKSARAKLENDMLMNKSGGGTTISDVSSKFKRKIDEVLCRGDSRRSSNSSDAKPLSNDDIEEKDSKKPRLSTDTKDSTKSRPMPASVQRKLQEKLLKEKQDQDAKSGGKEEKPATPAPSATARFLEDVDEDECEVCHRVFSNYRKRQKHELTVHFIENPRGQNPSGEADSTSAPAESSLVENSDCSFDDAHDKSSGTEDKLVSEGKSKSFNYRLLPRGGTCPICDKMIATQLKRHVVNLHFGGDKYAAESATSVPSPTTPTSSNAVSSSTKAANSSPPESAAAPTAKTVRSSAKLKPLKILNPGYQRTFKMYKTNKSKAVESKPDVPDTSTDAVVLDDEFASDTEMPIGKSNDSFKSPSVKVKDQAAPVHLARKSKKTTSVASTPTTTTSAHEEPKSKLTPANSNYECKPCQQTFLVIADYKEHMKVKHPKLRPIITCKICGNLFTAEDDFILHLKYRHKEVMVDLNQSQEDPEPKAKIERRSSSSTQKTRARTPSPDPDSIDVQENDDDDDPDFDYEMEVSSFPDHEEDSGLAITSTFSHQQGSSTADTLQCSTCDEKFPDIEALRKHQIYFHGGAGAQTDKMCPICGVYPARLGRHLIAHENKTVRCSCAPCNLNFGDFKEMLKHNLKEHPGPDGGGLSAANRPKEKTQSDVPSSGTEMYKCTLCHKEFPGAAQARRHVVRNHDEALNQPSDNFVKKVATDDDDEKKTIRPTPESSSRGKQSRPMPASVRAKLEAQKSLGSSANSEMDEPNQAPPEPTMAAKAITSSVLALKARLEMSKKISAIPESRSTSNAVFAKPRPMPASVRAKLMGNQESSATSSSEKPAPAKINRPMPASARAKLMQSEQPSASTSQGPSKKPDPVVVDIDDDDDDDDIIVERDLSFPQPELIATDAMVSAPIDHDLEIEHDRAVRISMGDATASDISYQCKMCERKFDSNDGVRRHILRVHREYGPEHTENLIHIAFNDYHPPDSPSASSGKYIIDDGDDEPEEEEVIIPRGTSRRPRVGAAAADSTSSRSSLVTEEPGFACKLCGKKSDTAGGVRRHIGFSHSFVPPAERDEAVLSLRGGEEQDLVPQPQLNQTDDDTRMNYSSDGGSGVGEVQASTSFPILVASRSLQSTNEGRTPESSTSASSQPVKYKPGPASRKSKLAIPSNETSSHVSSPLVLPNISLSSTFASLFPTSPQKSGGAGIVEIMDLD